LTNKYSEGLPGRRYYGGNEVIDKLENVCRDRALKCFDLDEKEWAVNVQPYSGSTANFCAFTALLAPNDRFMGLYLPDGGHLSHGYYRGDKPINASARYFQSLPYHVDPNTGLIDFEDLERTAKRFCPKMIVAGSSAYPRDWNYARLREICDSLEPPALLLVDMAHFSGLVAAKIINSPFQHADVVTTTTHKSMRSTRAAMIFCRKDWENKINSAVFPMVQGGPHNHAIAGIAVALREAMQPSFQQYAAQVVKNIQALCDAMKKKGYKMATDGTDTHLCLWDVRPQKLTGSKVEWVCDLAQITINKNTVHGDKSALSPGGVRIGSPALTSRGFKEKEFEKIADLMDRVAKICIAVQAAGGKSMPDFKDILKEKFDSDIQALRKDVVQFASKFPMPGRQVE
jgi:glycine hydroxymethyltransferase